jgi:polyhydroxyalkanoate synthesis regulator phasin
LLAAIFGVVAALGIIGGTAVWAQGGTQGGTPTPTPAQERCQAYETTLAQKLGISVEKLQQAQKDTVKDLIDQAVKNNKLTADQATQLKQKVDAAQGCQSPKFLGGFGGFKGGGLKGGLPKAGALRVGLQTGLDAAAKALDMTSDQLASELKSGKSIADIAKAKNVDLKVVRDAVIAAEKAAIDQAVKDNKLTQTQADKLKAALDKNADKILDRFQNKPGAFPNHRAPKTP